jgi:protein-tyrosine phosphatase
MDRDHYSILQSMGRTSSAGKIKLTMSYARRFQEDEVPDPYYGGPQGFERVLDMLEDASRGLLESLKEVPFP